MHDDVQCCGLDRGDERSGACGCLHRRRDDATRDGVPDRVVSDDLSPLLK